MIKKLTDLKLNTKAQVVSLNCDDQITLNYFYSVGIILGAKITVMSKGIIMGNPCAILIDNNENMIMLRASEASVVLVRELL
jgi:Fe2+ transport system protein FeoA